MRPRLHTAFVLLTVLAFASPAWAVVVTVGVKDAGGEPVAGATVTIGDLETTTDEDGEATADLAVEPGTRVEAVVTYRNQNGRDVVVRQSFQAVEGAQIAVRFPRQFDLPRRAGPALPGSLLGATFGRQTINDTGLASSRFTSVVRVGSSIVENEDRAKTPDEIAESNRVEQKNHRFGPDAGATIVIPLSPGGFGGRTARGGNIFSLAQQTSPAANGGGGGWRVYPSASLGGGRASIEFESRNLETPAETQRFAGNGTVFGVGVNAIVFPCSDCAWYSNAGYQYSRTGDITMRRTTNILDLVGDGVQILEDGGTYQYHSHTVRGTVGRAFRHVAPWAGVRVTIWQATLDIASEIDFTPALNFAASQSLRATNEYESTLVEAIGGLDIRIPRSPLFLRLRGSTDGDNHSFGVGFGVSLGG